MAKAQGWRHAPGEMLQHAVWYGSKFHARCFQGPARPHTDLHVDEEHKSLLGHNNSIIKYTQNRII